MVRRVNPPLRLILLLALCAPLGAHASTVLNACSQLWSQEEASARRNRTLDTLHKFGFKSAGGGQKGPRVLVVAFELGEVEGAFNELQKPLSISMGGVSTVMDGQGEYPDLMRKNLGEGSEQPFLGVMMDGIDRTTMQQQDPLEVRVENETWRIDVWHHVNPHGVSYYFLDNPSFRRLSAINGPDRGPYVFRGATGLDPASRFERHRILSAIGQGVAAFNERYRADVVSLQDWHVSAAAYYLARTSSHPPELVQQYVHSQNHTGETWFAPDEWDRAYSIYDVSPEVGQRYFRVDDHLVPLNVGVRITEEDNLFTGYSVSEGTADEINRDHRSVGSHTKIDYRGTMGAVTNGLSDKSRPAYSPLLKPNAPNLDMSGIHDEWTQARYRDAGFAFGFPEQTPEEILRAKADAKRAVQLNSDHAHGERGMDVNPDAPLFISFARLVGDKGMEAIAYNVRLILSRGGQIVVGGPTDKNDADGLMAAEQFRKVRDELRREGNPQRHNYRYIEGRVAGALKGLLLAGHDFFLLPSRTEPCGLTDLESISHGGVPIAHNVGGLNKSPTTILYTPFSPRDQGWQLGEAIHKAFDMYADRPAFAQRQIDAMREDFSIDWNFRRAAQVTRLDLAFHLLRELDGEVRRGVMSSLQAEAIFGLQFTHAYPDDVEPLRAALSRVDSSRLTPLMRWFLVSK